PRGFIFMSIRDCTRPHALMSSGGHASPSQRNSSSVNAQRWSRSAVTLLAASFLLGVSSVAVRAADDSSADSDRATNRALLKKLQAMEKRMQTLETELKGKQMQASPIAQAGGPRVVTQGRPTATPRQPGDSMAQAAAGAVSDATKNKDLFGVGTSPVPGLKIGMYGEIKFGTQQNPLANGQ